MNRTALFGKHTELKANIIEFFGWEMPLHYEAGTLKEHMAVRTTAGIFDVSHMGDFIVQDTPKLKLQSLLTNNVTDVDVGKGVYTHLPDESGKIIDDLIVTKLEDNNYFCVPNASMVDVVKNWMIKKAGVKITDLTHDLTCIALQGPESVKHMEALFGPEFQSIKKFTIRPFDFLDKCFRVIGDIDEAQLRNNLGIISRTGYTGEEGFEIILPNSFADEYWDQLINRGILPIGLGARDTLRLEMGYLLSGQDFNRDRTTMETNCSWVIKWDHDFMGKGIMEEQKAAKTHQKMLGININGKAPARTGSTVYLKDSPNEIVGSVSSGNYSPTLEHSIALAYFDREYYNPDLEVGLEYHGRHFTGTTTKTPFVNKK